MFRSRDLSVLSRGRGLVGGGVEIECFDHQHNFSLTGKAFLHPSDSKEGQHAKVFKPHTLALPQTYVTKRGPMVLFTSPEDMIFGKPLQLHQRETVARNAVKQLRTTSKLRGAAMCYDTEKDSGVSEGENLSGEEHVSTFPGHFTSVYLNSLREHSQKANENADDCTVEDIEMQETHPAVVGDSEVPLVSDCDSGLGQSYRASSGRLSALSHYSDGTVITIPDGRESVASVAEVPDLPTDGTEAPRDPKGDLLKQLASQYQSPTRGKEEKKKRSRTHETKKAKKKGGKGAKEVKPADHQVETAASGGRHTKKKRVHRSKKQRKADHLETADTSDTAHAEGSASYFEQQSMSEEITTMSMAAAHHEPQTKLNGRQAQAQLRRSRAEQRRLEIEQKRAEKREMEQQKKLEEERRALLEEQLRDLNSQEHSCTAPVLAAHNEQPDKAMDVDSDAVDQPVKPPEPIITADLERPKLSPHLLAFRTDNSVKARDVVSVSAKDPQLDPVPSRSTPKKTVDHKRTQHALEQGAKLKAEHNYQMRIELGSNRRYQSISKPFTFSYFQFVPPKVKADSQKSRRQKPRKK